MTNCPRCSPATFSSSPPAPSPTKNSPALPASTATRASSSTGQHLQTSDPHIFALGEWHNLTIISPAPTAAAAAFATRRTRRFPPRQRPRPIYTPAPAANILKVAGLQLASARHHRHAPRSPPDTQHWATQHSTRHHLPRPPPAAATKSASSKTTASWASSASATPPSSRNTSNYITTGLELEDLRDHPPPPRRHIRRRTSWKARWSAPAITWEPPPSKMPPMPTTSTHAEKSARTQRPAQTAVHAGPKSRAILLRLKSLTSPPTPSTAPANASTRSRSSSSSVSMNPYARRPTRQQRLAVFFLQFKNQHFHCA